MIQKKKNSLQELKKYLDAEVIDHGVILSLASELAKEDQNQVRFTVDAGLINRLGLELVSKQETAVAELVKNAYDADAEKVDLIFTDTAKPGGKLEIIDTGVGMTREQLISGFMRLSTQEKLSNPLSEKYTRSRSGRKGIGRFSAQRLGRKLTIQTRREDAKIGMQVVIDWEQFVPGKELAFISNKIENIDKLNPGTTLIIEDLRDHWDGANIARSYRYVSTLQTPFPVAQKEKTDRADPGFKTAFYLNDGMKLHVIADDETNILSHALAKVTGYIGENGQGYWSVKSKRFNVDVKDRLIGPERNLPTSKFKALRDVKFTASYFIIHPDLIQKTFNKQIKDTLDKWGGVRIYRNGFRVLPYGEPFDDWLRLERSSALREILPPHRNNNFLGYIELEDPEGANFEETASREGLVENEAYNQLRDYISKSLKAAAIAVAEGRGKKLFAKDEPIFKQKPQERVQEIIHELKRELKAEPALQHKLEDLTQNLVKIEEAKEQLIDEIAMLRVLGSLGLSIGEFTHEIRHNLAALTADVNSIADMFPATSVEHKTIHRLQDNVTMLRSYARYFDEAVADNAHRELVPHEIRDILNSFGQIFSPTAKRSGIVFNMEIEGYDLYAKPMHRSEWSSLLLNLFTNSVKAIKRAGNPGRIFIRAGEEDKQIFVECSDTGDGIPDENKEKIFEPFFTTSSPPSSLASANEDLIGAGLGLKISKDIVESHGGDIFLVTPPAGFRTCFRIEIPKATESELADVEN